MRACASDLSVVGGLCDGDEGRGVSCADGRTGREKAMGWNGMERNGTEWNGMERKFARPHVRFFSSSCQLLFSHMTICADTG